MKRLSLLFTGRYLKVIIANYLVAFGVLWLIPEPLSTFIPNSLEFGIKGYLVMVCLSLIWAVYISYPKLEIAKELSSPKSKVVVKVGDLFNEDGHIVIGMNDVFDTEIGDVIKKGSIQGQFLEKVYESNRERLDKEISDSLKAMGIVGTKDSLKVRGKNIRYPLGTVAILGNGQRMFFCSAYSKMGNDLTTNSDYEVLWSCLNKIWEMVRLKGQGTKVSMPIVGSDLARTGIPHEMLIQLIVSSFVLASKKRFVSRELNIVIYPGDYNKVDMLRVKNFIESACY